jgi:probable addiction module antidote protein
MTKFAPFDAADYLDTEKVIAEYLSAALEDPNPDVFLIAVRDVAKAHGITQLAKDTGLGRESRYKALAP